MQRRLRDRSCSTAETNMKRKDDTEKSYFSDDRERIQQELHTVKMENNKLLHENTKLKTQIVLFDKDLIRYEKLCEGAMTKSSELLLIQLKKHNKELTQQLKEKIDQVDHLKRNAKITKVAELEMENKVIFDELCKFKQLHENQQKQINELNQKIQMIYTMNNELQRLQKLSDMQSNENKILTQKLQQAEEQQKKQQIQLKNNIVEKEKRINLLEIQNKKLMSEKTNLKVTIQMLQDKQQSQFIIKKQQSKLNPIHTMELRFRLILRGITLKQLNDMFEGLRKQAKEQNIIIKVDDFEHILSQEPFCIVDKKKIQNILQYIQGDNLIDQFLGLIGTYETFDNFDFESEQEKIEQLLIQNQQKIIDYWGNNKQEVDIFEVQRMLSNIGIKFNQQQQLFYNLNLFEKSEENLNKIKTQDTINPFLDEDDIIIESQLIKNHPIRISEVSDEDHQD